MKARSTFTQILTASLLTFAAPTAWASSWFLPTLDNGAELWVVNSGAETEPFWLAPPHRDGNVNSEQSFQIEPHASRRVEWKDFTIENFSQLKALTPSSLRVFLKQQGRLQEVPQGRSSLRQGKVPPVAEALFLTNLSAVEQRGRVRLQNADGHTATQDFSLEAFGQNKIRLQGTGAVSASVEADLNILSYVMTEDSEALLLIPQAETEPPAPADRARFVMSDSSGLQSFVVDLSDPALIAQARSQLQHPDEFQARILIARISAGSGGINRDLSQSLRGSWSWHVTKVVKFAEMATQACDGSPEFVEDFLLPWLESASPICFWNYRIVRELTP